MRARQMISALSSVRISSGMRARLDLFLRERDLDADADERAAGRTERVDRVALDPLSRQRLRVGYRC